MINYAEYKVALIYYPDKVYPFEHKGLQLFAHQVYSVHNRVVDKEKTWGVTEVKTGMAIVLERKTKAIAITDAKERIDRSPHLDLVKKFIEVSLRTELGMKGD